MSAPVVSRVRRIRRINVSAQNGSAPAGPDDEAARQTKRRAVSALGERTRRACHDSSRFPDEMDPLAASRGERESLLLLKPTTAHHRCPTASLPGIPALLGVFSVLPATTQTTCGQLRRPNITQKLRTAKKNLRIFAGKARKWRDQRVQMRRSGRSGNPTDVRPLHSSTHGARHQQEARRHVHAQMRHARSPASSTDRARQLVP
jgi:hypothetical protein